MQKRSEDSCNYNGPELLVGALRSKFKVIEGRKFFRFEYNNKEVIYVPCEIIDKLREDEWVYDCGNLSNRKKG